MRRSSLLTAVFLLAFVLALQTQAGTAWAGPSSGQSIEDEDTYISATALSQYDGAIIDEIRIRGLDRTREQAVRWLLGGKEGGVFNAADWEHGIRKLYNTQNLYDIHTAARQISTSPPRIALDVSIRDRWTLLPQVYLQGGGGNSIFGGGIIDTNIAGYNTQGILGLATLNGNYFYDINLFQEFVFDTDYMFGLDLSRQGNPISVQDLSGAVTQNFVWARTQAQLLLGRRIGKLIRFFGFLEIFQDGLVTADSGTTATVDTFVQYRVRPVMIIGRSNLTNYLEEGYELTIAPTAANFFGGSSSYEQMIATYKRTIILPYNINLAGFTGAGVMTSAPLPYQFRLGGFDTVRGFGANRGMGTAYWNGSVEFRPTLLAVKFPLLDLVVLQGCVFTDAGWIDTIQGGLALFSAGVGVRFNFAQFASSIARFDLARAIEPSEGYDLSFGLSQFF